MHAIKTHEDNEKTVNMKNVTVQANAVPENWKLVSDPKTGKKYYYNKITKETSWKKPRINCDNKIDGEKTGEMICSPTLVTKKGEVHAIETHEDNEKTVEHEKCTKKPDIELEAMIGDGHILEPVLTKDIRGSDELIGGCESSEMVSFESHLKRNTEVQTDIRFFNVFFSDTTETLFAIGGNRGTTGGHTINERNANFPNVSNGDMAKTVKSVQLVPSNSTVKAECSHHTCEMFYGGKWRVISHILSPQMRDMSVSIAVRIRHTDDILIFGVDTGTHQSVAYLFNTTNLECSSREDVDDLYISAAAVSSVARGILISGGFADGTGTAGFPLVRNSIVGMDFGVAQVPVGAVFVYDVYTRKRHSLPKLCIPRANHAQAVLDDSNHFRISWAVYVIGGFDGRAKTAVVERYVLGQNRWEVMKPMLTARSSAAALAHNCFVWVFGGRVGNNVTSTVERMHTVTNDWYMAKSMRQARCTFSANIIKSNIFVAGGWDGCSWLSSCEAYDINLDIWREVSNFPCPKIGLGVCTGQLIPLELLDEGDNLPNTDEVK